MCVSVCSIMCIYVHVHPLVKNQNTGRWLLGRVCRVFPAYFKQLLCSVARAAAALKHSFVCDMTLGYSQAIHSSAAIFRQEKECMDGATWAV